MKFFLKKRGVVLIEVVIYAVLFVILSISVIQSLAVLSKNFSHASRMREISASAVAALERMDREIKEADTLVTASSTFNASPGLLTVSATHPSQSTRTVEFSVGASGDLLVRENGGTAYPLTAVDVDVSSLIFRKIQNATSTGIKIELELTHAKATTTLERYYITSVLRGIYQ